MRKLIWTLSLITMAVATQAKGAELDIRSLGNEGGAFVAVEAAGAVTVIPKSLELRTGDQPGLSIIVQEGMGLNTANPFYANVTLTYAFVTNQQALNTALEDASLDGKTVSVVQSMTYTSHVGVWDQKSNQYVLRPIDSGTTSFASSLVGTFEIEFANAQELGEFFQHPRPLVLITETQPQLTVSVSRDLGPVQRAVRAALRAVPLPTTMPAASIYAEIIRGGEQFEGVDIVAAIASELAGARLELGSDGMAAYVLPEGQTMGQGETKVTRTIQLLDRVTSTLMLDVCGETAQVLLIDIGKTGCESISEILENKS